MAQDDTLTATVSDNGIGITTDALTRLFDLFVQDTRARALHKGGLGIGLAVFRELAESLGGTIVARSAGADLGSEFVVTLRLSADLRPTLRPVPGFSAIPVWVAGRPDSFLNGL